MSIVQKHLQHPPVWKLFEGKPGPTNLRKGFMSPRNAFVFLSAIVLALLLSTYVAQYSAAAQEETIIGTVVKRGNSYLIEAEDGDYVAKGKGLSKLVNKMVEATGIIKEDKQGLTIQLSSIVELQDTSPD